MKPALSAVRPVADILISLALTGLVIVAGWGGLALAPILWPLSRLGFFRRVERRANACRPGILRRDIIRQITPGSRVLDIGAGDGSLGRAIAGARQADVTGVDIRDRNRHGIKLVVTDGTNLPFPDKSFDFVILSYILHHNPDPGPLLREAGRVCKGRVIVVEDEPLFGRRFFQWGHHRLFNPLLPQRGPIIYRYPAEWRSLFQENGLALAVEHGRWGILSTPLRRRMFLLAPAG